MDIRVGHSPDPDDAFMFYALAKSKIDSRGFRVVHIIEDIETLNQRALRHELEVTAVSCHAYAHLSDRYAVLQSGASVGDGYGPILVARQAGKVETQAELIGKKIAAPGPLTTAYLVLQLFAEGFEAVFVPFDQIFDRVRAGEVDYGLVIHEGQITYAEHGLHCAQDLGLWWRNTRNLPLPLGIDVIRKDLGAEVMSSFAAVFQESISYALSHREQALAYALEFGRGIPQGLGDRFVGMYVNHYTERLNRAGREGLQRLYAEAFSRRLIPQIPIIQFVD
jgi:1,4-dihydroxy-6-naphthoate synthase